MAAPDAHAALLGRDVQRYYQPWLLAQGSTGSLHDAPHMARVRPGDPSSASHQPQACKDVALAAFAQLAVWRLRVRRAFVSLIDARDQIILVEATRDSSWSGADDLWLGSSVIERSLAICEHCLVNTCSARDDGDGPPHTCRGLIVNDCRRDARFQERPYVVEEPGIRFYAGVPITTRSGRPIGAYAVVDYAPRNGLSSHELQFMEQTAKAVMEHLEWARDRMDRFRGERIVRGMASFIEGCSSTDRLADAPTASPSEPRASSPTRHPSTARSPLAAPKLDRGPGQTTPATRSAEPLSSPSSSSSSSSSSSFATSRRDNIALVYQRAANIIRDSTSADGVAIFNAVPGGKLDSVSRSGGARAAESATLPGGQSAGSDSSKYDTSDPESNQSCIVLAFSLADNARDMKMFRNATIARTTLDRYHRSYPHGKTFYFGDEGTGISSGDEAANGLSPERQHKSRKRSHIDHRDLLEKIPDAKVVCFLPLYDLTDDKLVAGCFLWTSVAGQMMDHDDNLGYLRAFANSVMSEIARARTQQNEMAKTTFIASMSHELRSPLHGILGAAELLKDTTMDSFQTGLVGSVATCGRTLLDTLNHVLDYSKINRLGKSSMRRLVKQNKLAPTSTSQSSLESLSITADVDLGILVEEVIDATTSGHAFKRFPGSISTLTHGSGSNEAIVVDQRGTTEPDLTQSVDSTVSVLLDITPRHSWLVRTQPGAIRRIVMNLLGNALKYTAGGFIAVSLRAQSQSSPAGKTEALIRVVDSGKGMSETFLRDRLFIPFSQEDTFQPGTGLGLSIVKQIVDSLGGSIEVRSQQDVGTEITVRLNLSTPKGTPTWAPDDELQAVLSQTRGVNAVLLDPFYPGEAPAPLAARLSRQEETLRAVCADWFGMQVTKSQAPDVKNASCYVYHEPPLMEGLLEVWKVKGASTQPGREVPIIMICLNASEAAEVNRNQGQALKRLGYTLEAVAQPCGPRKLAKVLKACLTLKTQSSTSATPSVNDEGPWNSGNANLDKSAIEAKRGTASSLSTASGADLALRPHQDPRNTLNAAVALSSPPPINPATPALTAATPPPERESPAERPVLRCLIVDDNKINLQLLVMFMRKQRLAYSEAENGQEALDRFKQAYLSDSGGDEPRRLFDVILMDISMPVMDGMEATRRIREFEEENNIPRTTIIALTGLASAQAQEDALSAGIDVFLPKPVKFAQLRKFLMPVD